MKSRLGLSVGMVAAGVYFIALFGGYLALSLFVGYILLIEPNPWLRKTAVKAFVVCLVFSLISTIFGFIPTAFGMLMDALLIFDVNVSALYVVNNLTSIIHSIIDLVRTILLLVLGFMAFNQSTIPLGPIDNLIHKHM